MKHQYDLFRPPSIERRAEIPAGIIFSFGGRFLRVYKTYGTQPDAPVIVEELIAFGSTLKGQFALWSADSVSRCLARRRL